MSRKITIIEENETKAAAATTGCLGCGCLAGLGKVIFILILFFIISYAINLEETVNALTGLLFLFIIILLAVFLIIRYLFKKFKGD
jgi:hypothetical protein